MDPQLSCFLDTTQFQTAPFIRIYRDRIVPNPVRARVTLSNGQKIQPFTLEFFWCTGSYEKLINDNTGLGRDQYAYYYVYFPKIPIPEGVRPLSIECFNVSYINYISFSANQQDLYRTGKDADWFLYYESLDRKIPVPNPFHLGNPSTGAYPYIPSLIKTCPSIEWQGMNTRKYQVPFIQDSPQFLTVYRPDQKTSQIIGGESALVNQCSDTYMYCIASNQPVSGIGKCPSAIYAFGYIKLKMPFVYQPKTQPILQDVDCLYYDLSFSQCTLRVEPSAQFWSINAQSLIKYVDHEGYAYVFWAPIQYFKDIYGKRSKQILRISKDIQGFLMPTPTYSIIWRIRGPNPKWKGNPMHATCYPSFMENQGIKNDLVFDGMNYCPVVYGMYATSLCDFKKQLKKLFVPSSKGM